MQSPAHTGGAAGASFLVLIEESGQPHDPPPLPDAAGPSTAADDTAAAASAAAAGASSAPPVPEFDWVQIRETWGGLQLYRHAPLDPYGSTRRGRLPPQPSPSPQQQRPRPRHGGLFSGGTAADRPASPAAPKGLQDGGGNEPEALTPFRPARLSTLLLLDCRIPSTSTASSLDGGPPSAKEILEGLSPLAPRIAFLHIIRDGTHSGGVDGGGGVRTNVLVTLDSVEAAEGWAAMTAEGRELSLGGQFLYVSGIVLLRRLQPREAEGGLGAGAAAAAEEEEQEDALLPCLKSLVDEVGASAAAAGGAAELQGGGSAGPLEYAQLGTVYACCDAEEGDAYPSLASCLAFGPPQDALALLSSLSLRLLRAEAEDEEEEEGGTGVGATEEDEAEEGAAAASGSGRTTTSTGSDITSPRWHAGRRKAGARPSALSPGATASRVFLSTPGLDSYLSELPTCLDCLDRIDPLAIGLGALAPPPPSLQFPSSGPYSSSPFLPHQLSPTAAATTPTGTPRPTPAAPSCVTCRRVAAHAAYQQAKSALSSSTTAGNTSNSSSGASGDSSSAEPPAALLPLPPPLSCRTCAIPENLWICLLCAHVGCGRYTAEHAQAHFRRWGHSASLELATGRVWDYVEDSFVHAASHQLLPHPPPTSTHAGAHGGHLGSAGGPGLLVGEVRSSGASASAPGAPVEGAAEEDVEGRAEKDGRGAKLAGLGAEYSALLMSQLEEQSAYYERLLAKAAAELAQGAVQEGAMSEKEREEAAQARAQIERLEEEHARLMAELREAEEGARQLRARNLQLLQEQKREQDELKGLRRAVDEARARFGDEVADLEAQANDLEFFLNTKERFGEELAEGELVVQQGEEEHPGARGRRRRGGR